MNANLVSILSWSRPYKSGVALFSVNVIFWFLMHQRPVCVLALGSLCCYLRYLWKHRIRPEVLVDPPDCEDWTTLSSYDFEQKYISLSKNMWNRWVNLRTENHLMWTTVTCTMWIMLGKLGSQVDFVTFLFLISNVAFLLIPLLKFCPSFELALSDAVIKEEDLIPEVPKKSSKTSKNSVTGWTDSSSEATTPEETPAPHPVRVEESQPRRRLSPTLTTTLTEGMLSRSISAAAASFVTSGISKSSVMSASAAVISSLAPQFTQSVLTTETASTMLEAALSPLPRNLSASGPDSLTPGITQMPDHEVVDSDPEDEFLFDAKHFDKSSSSSSTSNSFEIINNI